MDKVTFKYIERLNWFESSIIECHIEYTETYGFNIELLLNAFMEENSFYLFKFKNAELYLPRIRYNFSGIDFDKKGDLVFYGFAGKDGDNPKVIFFHEPDYKTEMEIYKLTEEESKKYYYV